MQFTFRCWKNIALYIIRLSCHARLKAARLHEILRRCKGECGEGGGGGVGGSTTQATQHSLRPFLPSPPPCQFFSPSPSSFPPAAFVYPFAIQYTGEVGNMCFCARCGAAVWNSVASCCLWFRRAAVMPAWKGGELKKAITVHYRRRDETAGRPLSPPSPLG